MTPHNFLTTHTNATNPTMKPAINEGSKSILFTHRKENHPVAYQGYGALPFWGGRSG